MGCTAVAGGNAENAIWGKRAVPVRPMAGSSDSMARHVILAMAGIGVLCLSFWITLIIIDSRGENGAGDVRLADVPLTNLDGSPRRARPSTVADLPAPPTASKFGAGWDGIQGLNALIMGPGPIGGGHLALSLVATPGNGPHRVGIALGGLPANRMVHAVAWIKAPAGTRVSIDVRDGEEPGHGPRNSGSAAIEVSPPNLLASSGNLHAVPTPGPNNWVKVQVDLPSSNGVFVVYFGLLGSPNVRNVDAQMILGGLELTAG
jgi:hypothetical protein